MPDYPASPKWSYPVTRTLEFQTRIATGDNGVEQRWQCGEGEETWTLPYPRLTLAQRNTLLTAFDTAMGQYAANLSLAFDGTTDTGLAFDADELSAVESAGGRWSMTVKLRKSVRATAVGTLGANFPALLSGNPVQLPFTHGRSYDSVVVKTEGGRYSYYKHDGTRRKWSAGGPSLGKDDALAIWDYFALARGRYASFGFTDPDSKVAYSSCRFSDDSLTLTYVGPGQYSCSPQIQSLL